jgi:hypothetical protein
MTEETMARSYSIMFASIMVLIFPASQSSGDFLGSLDSAVHNATGLPTPKHQKVELPNPGKQVQDQVAIAAEVTAATGCKQCAKDITNAGVLGQKAISDAAQSYGYIIVPPGDLGGILLVHMMTPDGETHAVPVQTSDPPPPTAQTKTWDVTVDCLAQGGGLFKAYAIDDIPNVANIKDGEIVNVTARKVCPEYNIGQMKSVTSGKMLMAAAGDDPRGKPGTLRHWMFGKPA